MRRLLRDIAEGKALGDTTTLADPAVVDDLVHNLGGNPSFRGIWLPRPGADVVDVCHGGWLWSCFLPLQMAVRNQGPKAAPWWWTARSAR